MNGHADVVRFLLEEGADMDRVPFSADEKPMSSSLIHLAAEYGHGDVVALLLQARSFKERGEAEAEAARADTNGPVEQTIES